VILIRCNRCSFKFFLKVGVEESIVNAPLVSLQSKNRNNAKSEVRRLKEAQTHSERVPEKKDTQVEAKKEIKPWEWIRK
jgi:DNA-directed RNA polymerase subunit RPC12/RpoP